MRTRLVLVFLMTGVVFAFARCGGGGEAAADPRLAPAQPNPSSPLAESMRALDEELLEFRGRLIEGESLYGARFSEYRFTELEPTDSTMLVDGFLALSMAYERHVSEFNAAPDAEKYAAVVGGCEACHMRSCPGPLERIAKRHLPDGE
ncbi:MAG: hypothetical protein VX880_07405 [Bacteroidota bacterium]|nr:hypothetical protein [Bacteroidota bacterium]